MKMILFSLFFLSCSSFHYDDFKNLRYQTEWAKENSILLKDGKGVEEKIEFWLIKPLYSGKFQGKSYFAVLLITSPVGTGVFRDLAVFSPTANGLKQISSIHLGDRVKVKKVEFVGEYLMVTMISHSKSDPMCCPSLLVTKKYSIKNNFQQTQ